MDSSSLSILCLCSFALSMEKKTCDYYGSSDHEANKLSLLQSKKKIRQNPSIETGIILFANKIY
ncbi:hypothetical protein QR98_0084550 [Sarcoptes scabiei]|uniref:Uncharacterized protein n=1 Tax=Sarcoptes scabiei TaxID=52283 RepID=A0A132AGH8_SARSC|nr:hypothetical protein QR98_0084550 [Sarcoptes scabiei]